MNLEQRKQREIGRQVWQQTLTMYESYLAELIANAHTEGKIDDEEYRQMLEEISEYNHLGQFEGLAWQEFRINKENLERAITKRMEHLDNVKSEP